MKSNCKLVFFGLLFLLAASICHAAFFVYFKDGTSREVTKLEFKGQHVELHLTTGKVLRMRKDSIDYKTTGIEPPAEDDKVILKGIRPADKIVEKSQIQSSGPSQEELLVQWNNSKETAIAIREAGSIRKGDVVHLIAVNDVGHTVIVKMADGNYKRFVINSEVFVENFEMKTPSRKLVAPETSSTPSVETEQPAAESGHRIKRGIRPSSRISGPKPPLIWPILMSMGLLCLGIVSTVVLSKTDRTRKKRVRR